jgi:hypothetical protein
MITHRRQLVGSLFRSGTCLALTGVLAVAGCGNPGEGTVQVSPEARARLRPREPIMTKGRKNQPVGQRPIGIKDRGIPSKSTR